MPISEWAVKEASAAYLRSHGDFEFRMLRALEAAEAVRERDPAAWWASLSDADKAALMAVIERDVFSGGNRE